MDHQYRAHCMRKSLEIGHHFDCLVCSPDVGSSSRAIRDAKAKIDFVWLGHKHVIGKVVENRLSSHRSSSRSVHSICCRTSNIIVELRHDEIQVSMMSLQDLVVFAVSSADINIHRSMSELVTAPQYVQLVLSLEVKSFKNV